MYQVLFNLISRLPKNKEPIGLVLEVGINISKSFLHLNYEEEIMFVNRGVYIEGVNRFFFYEDHCTQYKYPFPGRGFVDYFHNNHVIINDFLSDCLLEYLKEQIK